MTEQVIQSKQKQPLHRDLKGVHVLMAEDNDLNAELATIILEDAGMTVTPVSYTHLFVISFSILSIYYFVKI